MGEKKLAKLECSQCHRINYFFQKSKRKIKGVKKRLELKKYCPFCRKHTLHKEVK